MNVSIRTPERILFYVELPLIMSIREQTDTV